jgi:hypothetical protein
LFSRNFNIHTFNQGCQNRTGPAEPGTGPASGQSQLQNRSAHEPVIEPENWPKTGKNWKKPAIQNLDRFKKIFIF